MQLEPHGNGLHGFALADVPVERPPIRWSSMSRSRTSPATSICSMARSYRTLTARRIAPAGWKSSGRAYICGDGCSPSFLRPGGPHSSVPGLPKKQAVCGVSQTHRSTTADPEPVSTGRPARNAHPPVTVNQAHKAARRSGGNQRGHHAPTALSSGPGEISPQWGWGCARSHYLHPMS